MSATVWTSLEVAKLIVAGSTPVAVAVIGFWLARIMKRVELAQWRNQKVIERRMEVYKDAAPKLNQLLCYFTYVGRWKDLTPSRIIELKRELDAVIFVDEWLFSPSFMNSYQAFIHSCFVTYQGVGHDARLRTKTEKRMKLNTWQANWADLFKEDETVDRDTFTATYATLMGLFAAELGSRRDGSA